MEENKNQKENLPLGYFRGYKKEADTAPKKEAKAQYASESDKRKYDSCNLVVVVTILAVVVTSALLLWAVYSVIHVTRLSQLAGLNLTEEAKETASAIMNKKDDEYMSTGYEEWRTYENNIVKFKYAPEWSIEERGGEILVRKFNKKTYGSFDSLAAVMVFGRFDNPNNLPVGQILEENHRSLGDNPQEIDIAGKKSLKTEKIISDKGLSMEGVYWVSDKKIYYAETTYYDQKNSDLTGECQKTLDSLRFL